MYVRSMKTNRTRLKLNESKTVFRRHRRVLKKDTGVIVWHPVIVVVIDAVVGLDIHGLALYPSRVHGKWIVIVHSCGIILLVVVTTTHTALPQPTVAVDWKRSHGGVVSCRFC